MVTAKNEKKLIELANDVGVEVIYDCGSRDALDGLELLKNIKSSQELHIFEPNPIAIELCKKNISKEKIDKKIFMNEKALSDNVGKVKFYPINANESITPHKDGNIGASSLFKANPYYPLETFVQNEIEVETITIDKYVENKSAPNLLWIDLQGAEMLMLQGSIQSLQSVKIIYIEVTFREIYIGQPLFYEIDAFLEKNGFKLFEMKSENKFWLFMHKHFGRFINKLGIGNWFTNAIYISKKEKL